MERVAAPDKAIWSPTHNTDDNAAQFAREVAVARQAMQVGGLRLFQFSSTQTLLVQLQDSTQDQPLLEYADLCDIVGCVGELAAWAETAEALWTTNLCSAVQEVDAVIQRLEEVLAALSVSSGPSDDHSSKPQSLHAITIACATHAVSATRAVALSLFRRCLTELINKSCGAPSHLTGSNREGDAVAIARLELTNTLVIGLLNEANAQIHRTRRKLRHAKTVVEAKHSQIIHLRKENKRLRFDVSRLRKRMPEIYVLDEWEDTPEPPRRPARGDRSLKSESPRTPSLPSGMKWKDLPPTPFSAIRSAPIVPTRSNSSTGSTSARPPAKRTTPAPAPPSSAARRPNISPPTRRSSPISPASAGGSLNMASAPPSRLRQNSLAVPKAKHLTRHVSAPNLRLERLPLNETVVADNAVDHTGLNKQNDKSTPARSVRNRSTPPSRKLQNPPNSDSPSGHASSVIKPRAVTAPSPSNNGPSTRAATSYSSAPKICVTPSVPNLRSESSKSTLRLPKTRSGTTPSLPNLRSAATNKSSPRESSPRSPASGSNASQPSPPLAATSITARKASRTKGSSLNHTKIVTSSAARTTSQSSSSNVTRFSAS